MDVFKFNISLFALWRNKIKNGVIIVWVGTLKYASHVKIEAKSGEEYSAVAAKTMKVSNNYNKTIATLSEPNGSFLYSVEDKSVILLTNKTQENEIYYSFEGTKQ